MQLPALRSPRLRAPPRAERSARAGLDRDPGSDGRGTSWVYQRRYLVSDDRFGGNGDWYHWGVVASAQRSPYRTTFFVVEWELGEVMAVNTRVEGRTETREIGHARASEVLRVDADGTFEWRLMRAAPIRGRWSAAEDTPGTVLHAGAQQRDWTMQNQTDAIEEDQRKIETARLFAAGSASVAAKRPR